MSSNSDSDRFIEYENEDEDVCDFVRCHELATHATFDRHAKPDRVMCEEHAKQENEQLDEEEEGRPLSKQDIEDMKADLYYDQLKEGGGRYGL